MAQFNVIMSQARFNITSGNRDYNIVFGQGICFTQASEEVFDDDMEVNTVFVIRNQTSQEYSCGD